MTGLSQCSCGPLIDAFAASLGSSGHSCMNFCRNPQHEIAGVGFSRVLSQFLAGSEVIIHRFMKSAFQFGYGFSVKAYYVTNADDPTDKDTVFGIKFNFGDNTLAIKQLFFSCESSQAWVFSQSAA